MQVTHAVLLLERHISELRHPSHLQDAVAALQAVAQVATANLFEPWSLNNGGKKRQAPQGAAPDALLPVQLRCVLRVLQCVAQRRSVAGAPFQPLLGRCTGQTAQPARWQA